MIHEKLMIAIIVLGLSHLVPIFSIIQSALLLRVLELNSSEYCSKRFVFTGRVPFLGQSKAYQEFELQLGDKRNLFNRPNVHNSRTRSREDRYSTSTRLERAASPAIRRDYVVR